MTAEPRLKSIARDFVNHYSDLWTSGKAMFVCLNKVTCVRMYNYVQEYWKEEIKKLKAKRKTATQQEAQELERRLKWMQTIARANRISEGKSNGLIIDYIGVVKALRKALADYTANVVGNGGTDPMVNKDKLIAHIIETIAKTKVFLSENFDLQMLMDAYDLMCVFEGQDRTGMIADIKNVIPHIQDSDMVELAGQVLGKLETMSDAEFTEVALEAAE